MGSLENVLFHALSGIIVSRTKLCLYVVKGQDILNVIELLKHNQTIDVSSNCVFREETTHTHRNKPNSIHNVISNYVLHMHLLSCPNMVFLIVNQKFCFLVRCFCLVNVMFIYTRVKLVTVLSL